MPSSVQVSSLGDVMAGMIRGKDNGIHRSFMEFAQGPPNGRFPGGVFVRFGGEGHPQRLDVLKQLCAYRENASEDGVDFLMAFQVESVLNMAFRPKRTFVSKTIVAGDGPDDAVTEVATRELASPEDDIGMMVINDLFTGSGKTLTTMLGAVVFAHKRRPEIVERAPLLVREQTNGSWSTRVQCSLSESHLRLSSSSWSPRYSNVVVVMCAKHLFSQWKSACATALKILGMTGSVSVLENPMPGSAELGGESLKIVLLHCTKNLVRLQLEFVPVVVVDEFTIKSVSNVLTRPAEALPVHGRLLLVSADAGSIRDVIHGAHRRSFLRKMLQWDDISLDAEDYIAMVAGIPLISASVLQTEDRCLVGEFMINQLRKIKYERYEVNYTPSFASRIFGNNFEMSAVSGNRLISDKFGIELPGTQSIGQFLKIVADTVDALREKNAASRMLAPLAQLRDKLGTFVGEREACPICMDDYEMESGASLINPCWHIVCDKCLRHTMQAQHVLCPLCRTPMEGHTTALVDAEEGSCQTEADVAAAAAAAKAAAAAAADRLSAHGMIDSSLSLVDNMNAFIKPTAGLEKACIGTLRCIRADVGDRPYKIVMIVPDEHFFTKFAVDVRQEMDPSQAEILEFKTRGNKRKHVTSKAVACQIESFASDTGPGMKILFTTEGKTDSLTGLDFPRVDCIISLGEGNNLQRLGRLTRLPRMLKEADTLRTVRYICLEPIF